MGVLTWILGALGLSLVLADTLRWGIGPLPTSRAVRRCAVALLHHHLSASTPRPTVLELGCGVGGMAHALAEALPEARVVGLEGSGYVALLARLVAHIRGARITIVRQNVLDADLRAADGAFCYMYRGIMPALSQKLRHELPRGAWVLTHTFALPGWTPVAKARSADMYRTPVYLYVA